MKPLEYGPTGLKGPKIIRDQYLNLDGKGELVFDQITFEEFGQIRGLDAKKIIFYKCKFLHLSPNNEKCVQLFPGNDDWIFDECDARYMGDFIYSNYLKSDMKLDGAQRLTVKNCTGKYIGTKKSNPSRDGHFIGLQGGSGHKITGCGALETGTQIEFWARKHMPMRNILVEDCYIRVCRKLANEIGSGIVFSGEPGAAKGLRTDNACRNNTIRDCDGYGISSNWPDEISGLPSNTISKCKLGNLRITGL